MKDASLKGDANLKKIESFKNKKIVTPCIGHIFKLYFFPLSLKKAKCNSYHFYLLGKIVLFLLAVMTS